MVLVLLRSFKFEVRSGFNLLQIAVVGRLLQSGQVVDEVIAQYALL